MAVSLTGSTKVTLPNGKISDFSTPFKRMDILSELQKRIGEPLPNPNSDSMILMILQN